METDMLTLCDEETVVSEELYYRMLAQLDEHPHCDDPLHPGCVLCSQGGYNPNQVPG